MGKPVEERPKLLRIAEAAVSQLDSPQQAQRHNQENKHILDSQQEQQTLCFAYSFHFRASPVADSAPYALWRSYRLLDLTAPPLPGSFK